MLNNIFATYYAHHQSPYLSQRDYITHVVVPTEYHEQRARGRRDEDKPVLCKGVVPEQATAHLLVAHEALLDLVHAVERREVKVGRRVVYRRVARRRAEERVCHERRERERQRGVAVRVWLELCMRSQVSMIC